MSTTKKRPVLTTKEAAREFNVCRRTIYRKASELPGMEKIGNQWLLRRDRIDDAKRALKRGK